MNRSPTHASAPTPARSPCFDRTIEGACQGVLTGGCWGMFVALQARLKYPAPSASRQVSRIMLGYSLGIGSLLAIYNGGSCASMEARMALKRYRHSAADGAPQPHSTPLLSATPTQSILCDSLAGGFAAGFIASIPLHWKSAAEIAAASPTPAAPTAAPSPSIVTRLPSALLGRVHWSRCGQYGLAMAAVGAYLHFLSQPSTQNQRRRNDPDSDANEHAPITARQL